MKNPLTAKLRQFFSTRPMERTPITRDDLRCAFAHLGALPRTFMIRLFGPRNYCRVEETFALRWTGRYRFDFAESMTSRPGEQGGVIVFSKEVNAAFEVAEHPRCLGIVAFAERWAGAHELNTDIRVGCTFRGRYHSPGGSVYNGRCLTLQLPVMTKHELVKIATLLTREFELESVLVRHAATRKIYLVTSR